jgi:hypothetical protein
MAYRYRALHESEFRLIEFENTRFNNAIRFQICHALLISPPKYVALSYTWGKPFAELPDEWANQNARKNVYADGKEFSVQYNFEAALQRFQPDYLCPAFFFGLMQSVSIKTTSASEMIKSV